MADWSNTCPVILDDTSFTELLDFLLNKHRQACTLLVCSTRAIFVEDLRQCIIKDATAARHSAEATGTSTDPIDLGTQPAPPSSPSDAPIDLSEIHHPLLVPTLHLLSVSKPITTFFTPDVPHTLAQLSRLALVTPSSDPTSSFPRLLVIISAIHQHRGTASWSAQGLARFFAAASRAASKTGSKLVLVERGPQDDAPVAVGDNEDEDEDLFAEERGHQSLWNEEIGMLNVTTRSFGVGEKGWKGRTVSLRRIAGRWGCGVVHRDVSFGREV